ncbi:MAG: BACON domain-containing protein [Bacteroidaceae bacterium]|nr:BACON domain-containing protein [Bacteroidaceae bacterium]
MKLKYCIYSILFVVLALVSSCSEDNDATYLDVVRVSKSILAIPATGGADTIVLKSRDSWTIDSVYNFKGDVKYSWLKVSKIKGTAGVDTIVFSADAYNGNREANLYVNCGGREQILCVRQISFTGSAEATCAEVIAGPEAKTYKVTGVCTKIANTTYGNWYLKDETGEIYIYGTLDRNGATKNFLSLGLEVGDIVTIQGPKKLYNGTVELVDVSVVGNITKSLITLDSLSTKSVSAEGGELIAYLTCKGTTGVNVEIPDNAKSWLSITSISVKDTYAVVKFNFAANEGRARSVDVEFSTSRDGQSSSTGAKTLTQDGGIVDATVAEFNAAEVGEAKYRIAGIVTSIKSDKYGNFYVKDFSGETYVYGLDDFASTGIKFGDIVTLVGKRGEYKNTVEMLSATLESHKSVEALSVADFLTRPDADDTFYMLTGKISKIDNATYGNLYITDGEHELYVYGCYPGYGATNDARKNLIATAGIEVGDIITIIGYKNTYKNAEKGTTTVQLKNGWYVTHSKPDTIEGAKKRK